MDTNLVELICPSDIGAQVISRSDIQSMIQDHPGICFAPFNNSSLSEGAMHDFGATAIAIMGTAATAAAVKGTFDVIKTIIIELHKSNREKRVQEHEARILMLKIAAVEHRIDLNDALEKITADFDKLSTASIQGGN